MSKGTYRYHRDGRVTLAADHPTIPAGTALGRLEKHPAFGWVPYSPKGDLLVDDRGFPSTRDRREEAAHALLSAAIRGALFAEPAATRCPECHRTGDHKLGCGRRDGGQLRIEVGRTVVTRIPRVGQLRTCDLDHGAKDNAASVYGHTYPNRNCIRLYGTRTWVYDPGWETKR